MQAVQCAVHSSQHSPYPTPGLAGALHQNGGSGPASTDCSLDVSSPTCAGGCPGECAVLCSLH